MILDPGQEIEKYVVEDVLGEGGMAAVYRVRHRTLGAAYALKVLTVPNRKIRDRMIQEGRIQATIRHANVVQVVDVLDAGGMTGLLMEYVAGPSLDRLLANHRLGLEEALALFGGLMAGVEAAHRLGLVHRDLKPENVLLRLGDEGLTPKISDFGIAKAAEENATASTRPGAAMGTPAYMAPEQVRDASSVTPAADVYSLGTILYELVSGQKAFPGDHALDILNAVVKGDLIPIEELEPQLPAPVIAAIQGAMRRDPTERIQTVAELASVLAGRRVAGVAEAFPTRVPPGSPSVAIATSLARSTPAPVPARSHTPAPILSQDTLFPTPTAELTAAGRPPRRSLVWLGVPALTALIGAGVVVGAGLLAGLGWWWLAAAPAAVQAEVEPEPPVAAVAVEDAALPEAPAADTEALADASLEPAETAVEEAVSEEVATGSASPKSGGSSRSGGGGSKPASQPANISERLDSTRIAKSIEELRGPAKPAPVDPATAVAEVPLGVIPTAEPPAGGKNKPARIKLEPPATKVMLQDGEQYFAGNGRIPAGTYIVHVWYDTPVPKPQGRIQLQPGETVTLACRPEWSYCQRR